MTAVVGGTGAVTAPGGAESTAAVAIGIEPGSTESRVIDAVVVCAGRWGIAKTTVDDVAREAGVSRATVYRLFPGGKPSMVQMATHREVVAMLAGVLERLEHCHSLSEALVEMLSGGFRAVADQPALAYMRANEPAAVRGFFSFERLDRLFLLAAEVVSPSLHRFLDDTESRAVVTWLARLVVSHYIHPDPDRPLDDPAVARRLVEDHILAGLAAEPAAAGAAPRPFLPASPSPERSQVHDHSIHTQENQT